MMVALWIKPFEFLPQSSKVLSEEGIMYQAHYDYADDKAYTWALELTRNNNSNKACLRFQVWLENTPGAGYTLASRKMCAFSQVKDGWVLVSAAIQSQTDNITTIYSRVRTAQNGIDSFTDNFSNTRFHQTNISWQDLYVGGFCNMQIFQYTEAFKGTIGRIYLWKDLSHAPYLTDKIHDTYFFRSGKCSSAIASLTCKFCSVAFNPPATSSYIPQCTLSGKTTDEIYIANWNFDGSPHTTQEIFDSTYNQNHLMKSQPQDSEQAEVLRIYGQGYLFEPGWYTKSIKPFYIDQVNQVTIDAWIRRIKLTVSSTDQIGLLFQFIDSNNLPILQLSVSDQLQSLSLKSYNQQQWSSVSFPGLLQTSDWTYISFTASYFYYNGISTSTFRFTVNKVTKSLHFSNFIPFPQNAGGAFMNINSSLPIIINRLRIYPVALMADELSSMTSTTCTPVGIQPKCSICPQDTKTCLSICNENEFGEYCTKCNSLCGHCTGITKDDCVYCSRDTLVTQAFYSNLYGNCTCISGYYYNSTLGKCQPCDSRCQECYGPTNNQCHFCTPGNVFYPESTCVANCNEIQSIGTGFYVDYTQKISGQIQPLCVKCHPYCTSCFGPSNFECTACTGEFLLKNNTMCIIECKPGEYIDEQTKTCQPCDPSCAQCNGNSDHDCLSCTDPTKVLQGSKCKSKCDIGYYPDQYQICQICHQACKECTSSRSTTCGSCNPGYYLDWLGFSCSTTCRDGTYPDDQTNMCLLCHYTCETCSGAGPDKCLTCADNLLQRGTSCVKNCPVNEFEVNGQCKPCDTSCSTCFGYKYNECNSCNENPSGKGYYFHNHSCSETCPDGYYPDDFENDCEPCNPICSKCNSYDYCTQCIEGPYQLVRGSCNTFQCLKSQYLSTVPTLNCFDCHSSCLTCQGGTKFDCLSCRSWHEFKDGQCFTCKDRAGMAEFTPEIGDPYCVEICGDGYNMGYNECDDGNIINGDGCSSKCKIEDGFDCNGGSPFSSDICIDIKSPTPSIKQVSKENMISIVFDEEVLELVQVDKQTLTVLITGFQPEYLFEWQLVVDHLQTFDMPIKGFTIQIIPLSSFDGTEIVTIKFNEPLQFVDLSNNTFIRTDLTNKLFPYEYIEPKTKKSIVSTSSNSMTATLTGLALNIGFSVLFGGSVSQTWTLLNTIQLLSLFPLMSLNWPPITKVFFTQMLSSHGESKVVPNIYFDYMIDSQGTQTWIEEPLNINFLSYGWETSNFLSLAGVKLTMWTLLGASYPIVWFMKKTYSNKHRFCMVWKNIEQRYRYDMILRGFIVSFISIYLAALLNVVQMKLDTWQNLISLGFASAFLILLVYFPIQIINIFQRNYDKIETRRFAIKYSTLIKELDKTDFLRYSYYSVFLVRRMCFALQLVILSDEPLLQIGAMSLTALVMIFYILFVRPQHAKSMIFLNVLSEFLLLTLHLIGLTLLEKNMLETRRTQIGWIIIAIVCLYIAINWIVTIVSITQDIVMKYREWKANRGNREKSKRFEQQYLRWKKVRQVRSRLDRQARENKIIEEEVAKAIERMKVRQETSIVNLDQEGVCDEDNTKDQAASFAYLNGNLNQ